MSLHQVTYRKLRESAKIPKIASRQAAGADLYACVDTPTGVLKIEPHETASIPLGFATEFMPGHAALILPRSGTSLNKSLAPVNSPGLIDADYRGEWMVLLHNHSNSIQWVEDGERIAQVMFIEVQLPEWIMSDDLSDTDRGQGAFGSTGIY